MKILDGKLNLEDYRAVLIKDEDGKVVGISFPIDGFYDLVEDIEDYSYLEGYDPDADGTVPHELVEATILDGKNLICAWRKYKKDYPRLKQPPKWRYPSQHTLKWRGTSPLHFSCSA